MPQSIHPEALEQAQLLNISKAGLSEMIELAAPFTDDRGDWRYHDYVLDIREGRCYGIWEKDNPDSPEILRHRLCVSCAGEGCSTCEGTGQVYCDISSYIDMKADEEE